MLISAIVYSMGVILVTFFGLESIPRDFFFDLYHRTEYLVGALFRMRPTLAYFSSLLIGAGHMKDSGSIDYSAQVTSLFVPESLGLAAPDTVLHGLSIPPSASSSGVMMTIDVLVFIPIIWAVFTLFLSIIYVMRRTSGARHPAVMDHPQEMGTLFVEVVDNRNSVFIATNIMTGSVELEPFEIPLPPSACVTPSPSYDSFSLLPISLALTDEQPSGFEYYQDIEADLKSIKSPLDTLPGRTDGFSSNPAPDEAGGPRTSTPSPRHRRRSRRCCRKRSRGSNASDSRKVDDAATRSSPPVDILVVPSDKPVSDADPLIPPMSNGEESFSDWPSEHEGRRVVVNWRKGKQRVEAMEAY